MSSDRAAAPAGRGRRSAAGRARSARNALRHRLTLPVLCDPGVSDEVDRLAREIVGASAGAELHDLACRIAEAQIDLQRVRHARHRLLSSVLGAEEFAAIVSNVRRFAAMDRYERRALARRKVAIRAFDAAQRYRSGQRDARPQEYYNTSIFAKTNANSLADSKDKDERRNRRVG